MKDSFTINQSLTLRETLSAIFYIFPRTKAFKRFSLFLTVIVIMSNILGVMTAPGSGSPQKSILEIVGTLGAIIIIFSALVLVFCTCMYLIKPANFKNVIYHFTKTGVARTANDTTFSFPWRSFSKLTETKSFFLLYVSSFDAHIIAKRIFTDNAEMESFKQFVRANAGDWLLNE